MTTALSLALNEPAPELPYLNRRIMLNELTNEDLLILLREGKEEAFPVFVRRFKAPLFNTVFRYLGSREDAEDIVQEAFVKVFLNSDRYDSSYKASTWVYTIALNLARSAYKRKHRWLIFSSALKREEDDPDFMDTIPDESLSPEFFQDHANQMEIIETALSKINPVFREAVILRDMDGLSYEEIAVIMNIGIGTVKSKINRGRALLKHYIQKELDR